MKKSIQLTIKSLIFCGACILIARFCHNQTHGFAIGKITNNFSLEQTEFPTSKISKDLLNLKFRFFGRGFQSFVFLSENEQYVLKLFNNRHHKKIIYYSLLSHIPFVQNWARLQKTIAKEKIESAFVSYQLAFDEMKDQSALVYLHLNPTEDLPKQLTLIDPLNISHQIDPNQFAFLIQKKVDLVYPALQKWISRGQQDLAKRAITSLLQLFAYKWQHKISDGDPLIRTNYGFIGTDAIQIDVGPLSKQEFSKEEFSKEILRITASLKYWPESNAPELLPHLDQELHSHID